MRQAPGGGSSGGVGAGAWWGRHFLLGEVREFIGEEMGEERRGCKVGSTVWSLIDPSWKRATTQEGALRVKPL